MSTKQIATIIIILGLAIGGVYLLNSPEAQPEGTVDLGAGEAEIEYGNGATSTVVVIPAGQVPKPIPSLTRSFVPGAPFTQEEKKILLDKKEEYVVRLTENPGDINAWIQLGILRRYVMDYQGTREAWEYAIKLSPRAAVPHKNLADLAMYDLHDNALAEKEWKIALELDPKDIMVYRDLFTLYTIAYKEKAHLAPEILFQGLKVNPDAPDLMIPLAGYYKEKGDTVKARSYYEKALQVIKNRGGNAQLEAAIQADLEQL